MRSLKPRSSTGTTPMRTSRPHRRPPAGKLNCFRQKDLKQIHPTGFEPVTFGSVGQWGAPILGSHLGSQTEFRSRLPAIDFQAHD
jgi:hypothetical protein